MRYLIVIGIHTALCSHSSRWDSKASPQYKDGLSMYGDLHYKDTIVIRPVIFMIGTHILLRHIYITTTDHRREISWLQPAILPASHNLNQCRLTFFCISINRQWAKDSLFDCNVVVKACRLGGYFLVLLSWCLPLCQVSATHLNIWVTERSMSCTDLRTY